MALPLALPDPSTFLGVALVVNRNRDGPRFVFHYPSRILPPQGSQRKDAGADGADDDEMLGDFTGGTSALGGSRDFMPNAGELARWNHEDHLVADNGTQFVPWEYVVGLPTKALEGILTPPRAFHKKRFQISLDSVTYVSYPIHVPPSGYWDRARNKRSSAHRTKASTDRGRDPEDGSAGEKGGAEDKEDKASSMTMFSLVFILSPRRHEANELLDTMYLHVVREVNKVYKYCQESGDFIWQDCKKIIQLKDRARENKTQMSNLWKEILTTSSLAASMRDIYEAVCHNRIAVLDLSLGKGSVSHSVQIPMPFHIGDLQTQHNEAARSLWLTTANNVSRYDTLGGIAAFDKCFALLLTDDDEKKIIAELQARGDKAAAAMIELVKAAKPTLSFHQVSQLPDTMLTIQQVRSYAQHFIYWRRAIAVPPIHARDVYVLSPNCDMANLAGASRSFSISFPFAPPLVDFLAGLSSAPRPYKSFCPSKSHRPAYMRILAWLIRGGWVCQLCTFAYVVVWPELQYEVEYMLESDDLSRIKKRQQRIKEREVLPRSSANLNEDQSDDQSHQVLQHGSRGNILDSSDGDDASDVSDLSDTISSLRSSSRPDRAKQESEATSRLGASAAERAAERARRQRMAEKAAHDLAERATAHARKPVPKRTEHPSTNSAPHLAGILPYIILDASKPTGRESLYLSAIEQNLSARRSMPPPSSKKEGPQSHSASTSSTGTRTTATAPSATQAATPLKGSTASPSAPGTQGSARARSSDEIVAWNTRVGEMWPVFWKYFNGRSALERIALLEDMKRKDAWNLLSSMSEHLLCVRHW
ncbi:hypothetical protein F503_06965 [Ophiostoma piceae UAMH 11346]|uniref:Nitrogen permease regulator 3 n=1 Tax=Ophiostoma piceae (strain UAMH 11346) TaxID=1262450 RepID=S3C6R5_OPHP1|nr:hypothetical protein F503_06965 [Ophiostoma piceae UAMH 11346]